MNRRSFIQTSLLGIVSLATAKFVRAASPKGEHFIAQIHNPPDGYHVFLDGVDIHCCCRECHTGEGWADCWWKVERDATGKVTLLDPPETGWVTKKLVNGKWEMPSMPVTWVRKYGKVELRKVT